MLIHLKCRQNRSGRICGWIWGWTSWKSHQLNCMMDVISKMPLWNVQGWRKAWLWWKEGGGARDTQEVYGGLVLRILVYNTVQGWMGGWHSLHHPTDMFSVIPFFTESNPSPHLGRKGEMMGGKVERGRRNEREGRWDQVMSSKNSRCWCWVHQQARLLPWPTFLDSLRPSSTNRFSLGVKVRILALI